MELKTNKPIFLIGMPGAGKTTLGKKLAAAFNLPFFDTDDLVLKEYSALHPKIKDATISSIFSHEGETYFRNIERTVLKNITIEASIVACGGGLPCYFDNIDYLNKHGIVVLINTDLNQIERNIRLTIAERPHFVNKKPSQTAHYLQNLWNKRKYFYNKNKLFIQSHNTNNINDLRDKLAKIC